ncbi:MULTISPECIES: TetR/AcrR family transcriptional regulator [Cupriavidus]
MMATGTRQVRAKAGDKDAGKSAAKNATRGAAKSAAKGATRSVAGKVDKGADKSVDKSAGVRKRTAQDAQPAARKEGARATRGKPSGPGLTREKIVAAALEQIDRNGVMAFSLRDVARSLGVYPAALYWHVATRDDLLASVVEATMVDVAPEPGELAWQDWLRELFVRCRDVMRRHPNIAQLVGAQLVANASLSPTLIDRILSVLRAAGCPDDRMLEMYNVVVSAMVGFPTLEYASVPKDDTDAWAQQLQERTRSIRALDYPTLARYLPDMANKAFIVRWQNGTDAPMDSSFDLYVDVVIRGIESSLAR